MKNRKVYFLAAFLILSAAVLIGLKVFYGGLRVDQKYNPHLWRVNIFMNLHGRGGRANVRLTMPGTNSRQTLYNENFEHDGLVFYIRERPKTGNRIGFWKSELLDGSKSIHYTFSAQLRSVRTPIPDIPVPEKKPAEYSGEIQFWLQPSDFIQSQDTRIQQIAGRIVKKEKTMPRVMRGLYAFVRNEIRYRTEKKSKDAKATLDQLVANCGGQARLFAALSRAAGIPSRLVGGLILETGVKVTTHVWVENYIAGQWIPFDVVNNHFAAIPAHYLEIYRADVALIKHAGLSKFEYVFIIGPEKIPPLDNPWSLYALPIHFQSLVKSLLLIPLGALIVVFFRTVIGIPTFGTFTPILLALAFREIELWLGLLCLAVVIFLGWLLRKALDRLKILVIPRLAMVLTLVVILVLAAMVVGFHFGLQRVLYISLFPMVIMTWMIERFSVLEIEDGTPIAFQSVLGSAVVSVIAYYIFGLSTVRKYLYAFPELLLVIMALLLLLGRYTGFRLTEFWRFYQLRKEQKKA